MARARLLSAAGYRLRMFLAEHGFEFTPAEMRDPRKQILISEILEQNKLLEKMREYVFGENEHP